MAYEADFEEFWKRYPRRVCKLAAKKAYERARVSHGATHDELLAGIEAYIQHKPDYADFAHPASWLNSGRWLDEWETSEPQVVRPFTLREIEEYENWRRLMGGCGHRDEQCTGRQECMTRFIRHRRGEAA